MASGRQLAKENARKFDAWVMERYAADDWPSYVRANKLNRSEIARECGFAKSVFGQNPAIKAALARVEADLTDRGILRPAQDDVPVIGPQTAIETRDKQRLKHLEEQNHAMRAEVDALKEQLKHYDLLDSFLIVSGRLPR